MNLPDWVVDLLKQSPGLALGLLVGWFVLRFVSRLYDRNAAQTRKDHLEHLATKDAMIGRLEAEVERMRKERDKWMKQAQGKS